MLGRYLLALLLTLTIEAGVAWLLGLRKGPYLLVIALASMITHPALNYLLLVLGYLGVDATLGLVTILEIPVVVAEWQLLVYVFGNRSKYFFITSLLTNAASFLIGILVFWI